MSGMMDQRLNCIDTGNQQENKLLFNRLFSKSSQLTTQFENLFIWDRMDDRRPSRIRLIIPGSGLKDRYQWKKLQIRMVFMMSKFAQVFFENVTALSPEKESVAKVA